MGIKAVQQLVMLYDGVTKELKKATVYNIFKRFLKAGDGITLEYSTAFGGSCTIKNDLGGAVYDALLARIAKLETPVAFDYSFTETVAPTTDQLVTNIAIVDDDLNASTTTLLAGVLKIGADEAGWWNLHVNAQQEQANRELEIDLYINGIRATGDAADTGNTAYKAAVSASGAFKLKTDDEVTIEVRHRGSATRTILGRFSGHKI